MPLQKAGYAANSTAEIEGILEVHEWQERQAEHRFLECVI